MRNATTFKVLPAHGSNQELRLSMEKVVNIVCTLLTFVLFFFVLKAWDLDEPVRFIWAALFAGAFSYIFFRTRKKTEE